MPARNLVLEKPSYGPPPRRKMTRTWPRTAKDINEAGFAAFADTVGARSMAEMLEAAAAYATCVENRTQFTRPQLMRRMMAGRRQAGQPRGRSAQLRHASAHRPDREGDARPLQPGRELALPGRGPAL
jgi:hypothetical protein